jgi:hypothetical protein
MRFGISSVYSFVILYLLVFAGIYAIENVVETQNSLNSSVLREQQLSSKKLQERLEVSIQNGSIILANRGTTQSKVVYLVERLNKSFIFKDVSINLYPDSVSSLPLESKVVSAGVVTSLGNSFFAFSGGPLVQGCSNTVYTVTLNIIPSGSGYTDPQGIASFCAGETVQLTAYPARGYNFLMWNGSLSSTKNPLAFKINSSIVLNAIFIPSLSIKIFPPSDGFSYLKNKTSFSDVVVYGAPETVALSVRAPQGVNARVSPSTVVSSIGGTVARLYVSYKAQTYYSNISILVTAAGKNNNQIASATYDIVQTPTDGICCSSNAYNSFKPRNSHAASLGNLYVYFYNTIYTEPGTNRKHTQLSYKVISNSKGFWQSSDTVIASNCQTDTPISVYSTGNQIAVANLDFMGDVYFNIGVPSGVGVGWHYGYSPVGYCSTGITIRGTKYPVFSNSKGLSLLIDDMSNIWLALDTVDSNSNLHHVEVLKTNMLSMMIACPESSCRSMTWEDVFVSQPLSNQAVPSLLYSNGKIILVYQVLSPKCNPDNVFISSNQAKSWQYAGSGLASGYPLCYDKSSGTVNKDVIYFGGVNSLGQLSWWSLNLTSMQFFTPSTPYLQSATSGAMLSYGNEIVLAYISGNKIHIAYSYRPESFWVSDSIVAYGFYNVEFAANADSYQLILLCSTDFLSPNPSYVSSILFTS